MGVRPPPPLRGSSPCKAGQFIPAGFDRVSGTVPNLGDLTTDEYSFVIKCTASRHLPVLRKNSSALQGRWLKEPEGFPTHVSFRKGNKRGVTALRMANKTTIMTAARETKRHYGRRKANRRGVTARAEFIKSPLNFYCPEKIKT